MKRTGFTLLEVLAAMAIFSMIMVMMGNIFHQSSIAWDSGTRKAQGAIEARIILANMARELQHAVALQGDALDAGVIMPGIGQSSLTFMSIGDREAINNYGSGVRDAYRITYSMQGDSIVRREEMISQGTIYDLANLSYATAKDYVVATNVAQLYFNTAPPSFGSMAPHMYQNLPRWVTITLEMGRVDDVSGVAAVSSGPNTQFDPIGSPDDDDIRTY